MKKIIPIISLIGTGAILGGLGYGATRTNARINSDNVDKNLTYFQENVENFNNSQGENSYATASYGKYELTLSVPNGVFSSVTDSNKTTLKDTKEKKNVAKILSAGRSNAMTVGTESDATTLELTDEYYNSLGENSLGESEINPIALEEENETANEELSSDAQAETGENQDTDTETGEDEDLDEEDNEKISTLYSLSSDIEEECEDFVLLKESIINSITETKNLIEKVNSNEIELTTEQKLYIIRQSNELKTLGKELSRTTSELNVYLSDLSDIFKDENGNLDELSVKYLLVLDNLANGNELLENGLSTIRIMNSIMNMNNTLPPNNTGRILYGFRHNDNPPIVRDYTINEDGTLTENNGDTDENSTEENENNGENGETNETNINTLNSNTNSNIDSYNYGMSNIDTFFNTALMDNEFMFGRNGYGYGGLGMYGNGYGYGYGNGFGTEAQNRNMYDRNANFSQKDANTTNQFNAENTQTNNTTDSVSSEYNTPNNVAKQKKGFKLKKNIDTYRSENTPTLNARFKNLKQNVSNFFSKPHKAENPVYRFSEEEKEK